MIECLFHSPTLQQQAMDDFRDAGIEVREGQYPDSLEIDRDVLVADLPRVEGILDRHNGRFWAD